MNKNGLAPEVATSNERPLKRQRVAPPSTDSLNATTSSPSAAVANNSVKMGDDKMEGVINQMVTVNTDDHERECEVGIIHFVNPAATGFSGVLKQRYTDFMVNEIALDGTVLHLTDDRAPNFAAAAKAKENYGSRGKDEENVKTEIQEPEAAVKSEDVIKPSSQSNLASTNEVQTESVVKDEPFNTVSLETNQPADPKTEETDTKNVTVQAIADVPPIIFTISPQDEATLATYFGDAFKDEIIQFHKKILAKPKAKPGVFGSLLSAAITDRALRGRFHADMRRIFQSRLETESLDGGSIKIFAASQAIAANHGKNAAPSYGGNHRGQRVSQAKGKLGWQELGGEYLHFTLFKENKDTMEVNGFLARLLKVKPRDFSFAGTKDRRAVTVQRVSIYRQHAKDLARHNSALRQARIGNFKYEKHPLKLGDLNGNLFTVALRDCHFDGEEGLERDGRLQLANEILTQAVKQFETHGFLNYFGLQRFGTFGIGTDSVGKLILNDDFEGAVKAILTYNHDLLKGDPESHDKVGRDDIARARAISLFEATGHSREPLDLLPRKFSAEASIIRHLGSRNSNRDFSGSLRMIHRNLKTMYVHAYQSLVWNMAASERWTRYGAKVIAGDLVIVDNGDAKATVIKDEVDQNGEIVVHPADDDAAIHLDDMFERARPLTAEEAESGKYTIFDIVLPSPGFDVEYPANDIGDFYKEFMGSERGGGLDPSNMRRSQKDFSLSGNYRKLMSQAKDLSFEVKWYHGDTEQLAETDLEILEKDRPKPKENNHPQQRNSQNDWYNQRGNNNNRGRGSYGNRGGASQNSRGRFNNDPNGGSNRAYRDIRLDEAEEQLQAEQKAVDDKQKATDDKEKAAYAEKLSAWNALPAKLEAEQKAALQAAQYRRDHEPAFDASTIKQPEIKETFIQTGLDENGRRVVLSKKTMMIGMNGELREVTEADLKVDRPSKPSTPIPNLDGPAEVDEKVPSVPLSPKASDSTATPAILESPKVEEKSIRPMSPTSTEDLGGVHLEPKLAVIVKFALGSSQYATMALRELMKAGGVKTYKPDYSSGR